MSEPLRNGLSSFLGQKILFDNETPPAGSQTQILTTDLCNIISLSINLDSDNNASMIPEAEEAPPQAGGIVVHIRSLTGRTFDYQILPSKKVLDLKAMIEKKEKVAISDQRLIFERTDLDNDKTLQDCHIIDGSIVFLSKRLRGKVPEGEIEIEISSLTGKRFTLKVTPQQTIEAVKAMIEGEENIPVANQRLIFNSADLDNDKTLEHYQILNGSLLYLVLSRKGAAPAAGEMEIIISSLSGKRFTLKVTPQQTIEAVKAMISSKEEHIPVADQRLIFNSADLANNKTLEECDITDSTVLYLIKKIKNRKSKENEYLIIPRNFLAPRWDYDFTNIDDTGVTFSRGGLPYYRPVGFQRFAIHASGMYDNKNDVWLGSSNAAGEWAVAYHGTDVSHSGGDITDWASRMGETGNFGLFFCTPNVATAMKHSKEYLNPSDGKKYKLVIQSRVNPKAIKKASEVGGPDDYWYMSDPSNIRSYAFCIKAISA